MSPCSCLDTSLIGGEKSRVPSVSSDYGKSAVRKSLLHFLFGKALNAVVSVLTLVALARWLAPDAYGVYIAFIALQSTLLALFSLGIDSTTERFMPELRTHHADSELLGFVMASMCARFVSLLILAVVVWSMSSQIVALVGLEAYLDAFKLWIVVVVLAGMMSFAVVLLEAMLHQRQAQICMSIYVVSKLILIGAVYTWWVLDLDAVVFVEMLATGLAASVGTWTLMRRFPKAGLRRGWRLVVDRRQRMQRFAFFNYAAQVVFQLFNAEVMKLVVTRLLGVVQSARYGFAHSLADTVQRYLPAVLLLRLIKPVFISRYTKTGDLAQLNRMARIILKLNLLVLAPAIALAAVFGGDLLSVLSKGKYADAHWIFVGVLGLLVLSSHQLVLSILASTLERNAMQLYAGVASSIGLPCALYLVPTMGALGAVAASAISGVMYNTFATVYLRRTGFDYRPDLRAMAIFVSAGVTMFGISIYAKSVVFGPFSVVVAVVLGGAAYVAIVRTLGAFSVEERALLNSILPKQLFIF
ncbi:MAG: lipopolysaccharide biosynthesis protein [Denitromonas halophila]|nr:MAG: lipopolysaccharide biosynthesis protein [Denitromonas halophila]